MKIYYLSDVDLSRPKGPSVNELEFVDALLEERSFDSKVFVPRPAGKVREHVAKSINHLVPFQVNRRNLLKVLAFELAMAIFLIRNQSSIREGFLVTRVSVLPLALFLLAPRIADHFHVKTVGDGSFRYLLGWPGGRLLVHLHKRMYRRIAKYAHSLDMVTTAHKDGFALNVGYGSKCFVVPNRTNTNVFSPAPRAVVRTSLGLAEYDFVYGYVGNDPMERGAREAIEALTILRETHGVNAAVMIIGDLSAQEYEHRTSARLGPHVRLLGSVDYGDVPFLMNALDVGVSFLPEWHRGASEQKVRQYLACGVVPVVTPGGSDFVAADGIGFVCENKDIEDVANTILQALRSTQELSARCRKYAEQHLSHKRLATDRLAILSRPK